MTKHRESEAHIIRIADIYGRPCNEDLGFISANRFAEEYLNQVGKSRFEIRCLCGVLMHLCKGPINYYFAVNAKSRHDDNCPQNHHKDENRREQDRLYRERKRTEISGTLVGQEALSSILNKTARSHENEILRNLSVATPPLSGKQEGQKQKRTLTYNQQSDAAISFASVAPDSIRNIYIQRRIVGLEEILPDSELKIKDTLFVRDTKQHFRRDKDVFGNHEILALVKSMSDAEKECLIMPLGKDPETKTLLNPTEKSFDLMWDCFSVSMDYSGEVPIENNHERVVFLLFFGSEEQKNLFDRRFGKRLDSKTGSPRANPNAGKPHVILCNWKKEYDGLVDVNGHPRRIVRGTINNFENQIQAISDDIFTELEDETP